MSRKRRGGSTPGALLVANGITKKFGSGDHEVTVLKGIDLELYPGELTLLMGPSGSGKTTLISILGCILGQTDGSFSVAGIQTKGMKPDQLADLRRNHVGFVFQGYNLFPTLTALENVMLAIDVRGGNDPEGLEKAARALIAVGLSHRINTYPSKLSGGEKQRVALARSLAGRPSVILADEPTAALDSENGQSVMELLSEVAKDPTRAVLAVTHDHRTLKYADRIVRIEDGRIHSDERKSDGTLKSALSQVPSKPVRVAPAGPPPAQPQSVPSQPETVVATQSDEGH